MMDMEANQNDLITRFLLGDLSEDQRREVEERFLSDNEFFEQVMSAEDALIDRYLLGGLSKQEESHARALFESSREQRQNVEFTKQIISLVGSRVAGNEDSRSSEASSGTYNSSQNELEKNKRTDEFPVLHPPHVAPRNGRLLWAVVVVFAVMLGSGLVYLSYKARSLKVEKTSAEQTAQQTSQSLSAEIARRKQLIEELESERRKRERAEDLLAQLQSKPAMSFTSVILRPARFERSGNSDLPTLRVSTPQIRIQLVLDTDRSYEKYSVWISTFEGREVWSNSSLKSDTVKHGKLAIVLTTKLLDFDDYKIELRGAPANGNFEHLADYGFRLRH